ncbi:leucine-rich repeat-containing protein 37A2-like isoform X4 [Castor canadensis]|uniref:Leucine-rich repeat-containing protein 37A2-like isoform X4 n=1 Tax=Castor canadensis TaxID=51338 RepID=A0AC58K9D1_CASCN
MVASKNLARLSKFLDRDSGRQPSPEPDPFAVAHQEFLDRDSGRQPSPEPDPFAAAHQELSDELNPEAVPMPNREQNQGPTLPPPLQSKTQTVSLDQASESQTFDIPVPPLDRQISKVAKFIVSRWKLKKDAAQHQRLDETVAGTPHQFANLQPVPAPEVTVQPPAQDQAEQDTSPSVTGKPVDVEITISPEPTREAASSPTQPSEFAEGAEPSLSEKEQAAEPSVSPGEVQPSGIHMTAPAQASEHAEESEPPPPQQEQLAQSSVSSEQSEALKTQHEIITQKPEPLEKDELSPVSQGATAQPEELPEEPSPSQQESSVPPVMPPVNTELSPIQPQLPTQSPESSEEVSDLPPLGDSISFSPQDLEIMFRKQHPNLQETTVNHVDEITVTPQTTVEFEPIPVQQDTQNPTDATEQLEFSPTQSSSPSQTLKFLENIESFPGQPEPIALPSPAQPHPMVQTSPGQPQPTAQPPVPYEMTVPLLSQDESQYSMSSVTIQPLDLELPITSKPTTKVKNSPPVKKTRTPPPKPHQVTLPHPVQVQAQHPGLTEGTIQPVDLQLSITVQPITEDEPSPAMQETPVQLTEPPMEVVPQFPVQQEMTVPIPGQDEVQYPTSPSVTFQPSDLELTITTETTTGADLSPVVQETSTQPPKPAAETKIQPSTSGQDQAQRPTLAVTEANNTTTPPPQHPEVTPPHSEQLQSGLERTTIAHSVNPTTESALTVQTEPNATPYTNICELCTCRDESLLCVGLSPTQKLHRVPVPKPNTYKKVLTTLNFHGNAIDYIDKNTWKAYRWTEKLILSENRLTELRKDSFEGLLSLEYLDLSCNKIQYIERRTFESLPFLKFVNLGCNLITELNFGTFQAWHGMQFLHQVILSHNPLTTVEDSHLFKLPALKYLDLGKTQVRLATLENILLMTLKLEKLILPRHMACCLCQFKYNIEFVCKTVKLHCDNECLTNTIHCVEEASIGNTEGKFMKVLQTRKKSTSTELTIEPERGYEDQNSVSFSGFINEQPAFNDESDLISALNYILPFFSQGNLEEAESKLLPFIKLLFSNVLNGNNSPDNLKNNIRRPTLKPSSNNLAYKNKLNKLYFLENVLDAEIQEKIDEVKEKEKAAMFMQPSLLGPKSKRQIFQRKMDTAQPQENSLAESAEKRLQRVNRVLKGPKGIQKRPFKEVRKQSIWEKQSAPPLVETIAAERRDKRPRLRELEQLHMVQEPRISEEFTFQTEPSLTKEQKATVSSLLIPYSVSTTAKPLPEVRNKAKDLTYTMFVLEDANARVRNMEASKPSTNDQKNHLHQTGSHVLHRIPKSRKKKSHLNMLLAHRPPFCAVRSLISSPSRRSFSSLRDLSSQNNPFSELNVFSEPVIEDTPIQKQTEGSALMANTDEPEDTLSEATNQEDAADADSSVGAFDEIPTVKQTSEIHWEYPSMGTDSPTKDVLSTLVPLADHLLSKLIQQLPSLIPNSDVRALLSRMIRTLGIDCSDPDVQAVCSKFILRTGYLMKVLSTQQEASTSRTDWDTDQWKTKDYISDNTDVQSKQKGQESSEFTEEVPGSGYNNKVILAGSLATVLMILIIICIIEIYSHRRTTEDDREGSSRGFFAFLRRRYPTESESQEGFLCLRQPLWLRDMYRPLSATQKKNMAQKLHDKDSSDEDEIFNKDAGEFTEVIVDSSGSSREKGLNDSPSEVSEEASGTSKEKGLHYSPRELGEVVVTIPAQVDSARG